MAANETGHPHRDVQFLERVQRDVAVWQAQGIITPEQGRQILAYYQVSEGVLRTGRTYARLITVLATLGAVLIGTGVILFIASNWQEVPLYGKATLLVAGIGGANLGGYWLKYQRDYSRIGSAILFLAALLFGAGIFLSAQAYHIQANNPDLLFWWGLGVLPVAYLTRSRAMLVLVLGIALVWPGWKMGTLLEERQVLQAALALYLTLGAAIYALGALHSRFPRMATFSLTYTGFGVLAMLGALYAFSFEAVWTWGSPTGPLWGVDGFVPIVATGALVAASAAAVAATLIQGRRRGRPQGLLPYEAAALLVPVGLTYLILWNPNLTPYAYTALFNLALFGAIVATVTVGAIGRRTVLINLGLAAFAVDLVTRYADLLWGYLDTALFFSLGGVLLLGAGFLLERARRRLLVKFNLAEVTP